MASRAVGTVFLQDLPGSGLTLGKDARSVSDGSAGESRIWLEEGDSDV